MKKFSGNEILKASEIGQYEYCSVAWFLQRLGKKPIPLLLDKGSKIHEELGSKVTTIQEKERTFKQISYIGYILLIMIILFLVWFL